MVRGSGSARDSRKPEPHETYHEPDPDVAIGTTGDRYDRYSVRMQETRQSVNIIVQRSNAPPYTVVRTEDSKITPPSKTETKQSTESLIHHSKPYSEGVSVPTGETYAGIEAPKGEFGAFLVAGGNRPYRRKTKAPGSAHLQGSSFLAEGHMIADVVTIIGTQDIVSGEVDR